VLQHINRSGMSGANTALPAALLYTQAPMARALLA
jgi:hypothetical protein